MVENPKTNVPIGYVGSFQSGINISEPDYYSKGRGAFGGEAKQRVEEEQEREYEKVLREAIPREVATKEDLLSQTDKYIYDPVTNTIRSIPVKVHLQWEEKGGRSNYTTYSPEIFYLDNSGNVVKKEEYGLYDKYVSPSKEKYDIYLKSSKEFDPYGLQTKSVGFKKYTSDKKGSESVKKNIEQDWVNNILEGTRFVTTKETPVEDNFDIYSERSRLLNLQKSPDVKYEIKDGQLVKMEDIKLPDLGKVLSTRMQQDVSGNKIFTYTYEGGMNQALGIDKSGKSKILQQVIPSEERQQQLNIQRLIKERQENAPLYYPKLSSLIGFNTQTNTFIPASRGFKDVKYSESFWPKDSSFLIEPTKTDFIQKDFISNNVKDLFDLKKKEDFSIFDIDMNKKINGDKSFLI